MLTVFADSSKVHKINLIWVTGTMASDTHDSQWPQLQLQKLQQFQNLSKDNMAIIPQKVSNTLLDVKKNGETLMITASERLKKFGEKDSFGRDSPMKNLRKSASEANVLKPRLFRTMSTVGPKSPPSDGFNWLAAFNQTINQARESNRSKFQLPSRASLEQVRRCIHSLPLDILLVVFLESVSHVRCRFLAG